MYRRSLIEYLAKLERHGSDTAYLQRRGYRTLRWSYREIAATSAQFARELEARQIIPGDRVLLWGENSAEWVIAFFGCVQRGAVVVPMDQAASADFGLRVAQQARARLMVASRARVRTAPGLTALAFENLQETLARHPRAPYPSPERTRQDIVEIVFTSGTTAEPKGVVISHGNVLANLEPIETAMQKYLKYERIFHPLRFLNLLPLSHVFGQFLGLFIPQLLGATVVFQESLNPSEIVRTIRRERISVLVGVPRVLDSLRGKIHRDLEGAGGLDGFRREFAAAEGEHFLKRWWRFRAIHRRLGWKFWAFISGGAALAPETEEFWSRLGYAVIQGYGLTETTSLVSVNHPFHIGKGSVGKVLPGLEVKLDPNGEILERGENVAAGYWHGQAIQPAARSGDGWFRTGDIGALDTEGNLYFKRRKKNVIVTSAGMNVYPEDLEAVLRRQPEVRDCVVVGLERAGNFEPCAVVILADPTSDPAAIVQRANAALAEYQRMRHWFVWPEQDFPRTSTGKPRTNLIAGTVQAQIAVPVPAGAEARTERAGLSELIARIAGRQPAALHPAANLETDLHLNSLDRVELLSAIEDRFQVDLNETHFTAANTVAELERVLRETPAHGTGFYFPRWAQRWPVPWVRLVVYYLLAWPATLLLGYPGMRGRANLRGVRGPVLVVSNHVASIDTVFLLAALPLRLRFRLAMAMGGERLEAMRRPPAELGFFRGMIDRITYALLVAIFNIFPLPKYSGFRGSFHFAGELVDRGYSLLVFPEGDVTPDGSLLPFRAGIGLLANNLGIPIVPMRIDGLFELKQKGRRFAPPGRIKVTIGAPVHFPSDTAPHQIARELERRITAG